MLALTIIDDDEVTPLSFALATKSVGESAGTVTIALSTTDAPAADQQLEINISNGAGCTYSSDHTTNPSPANNKVTLTIPKGA